MPFRSSRTSFKGRATKPREESAVPRLTPPATTRTIQVYMNIARDPAPPPPVQISRDLLASLYKENARGNSLPPPTVGVGAWVQCLRPSTGRSRSSAACSRRCDGQPPLLARAPSDAWPAASQIIVKEEKQLNEPKPIVRVKHIWNPEDLAGRPATWKEQVRVRKTENTDSTSVRQHGQTLAVLAAAALATNGSRRPHASALRSPRLQGSAWAARPTQS